MVINIMNRILISRDKIDYDSLKVNVSGNVIKFLESGIYSVEYENIEKVDYCFLISDKRAVILSECSFSGNLIVNNKYIVDNGNLIINKFYDNDSVLENVDIELYNNGKIDYKFSNICKNNEDYTININHMGIGTESNINNKSVAVNGGKLNFVINSIVGKEYEKSILNQNTRIVTIGECDCKISPNMFIDCDNIEARHGSVIGTFKDDMLFYLMSRGINYNDSVKLLIKGYFFSNIDVNIELRDKILSVIDKYWR